MSLQFTQHTNNNTGFSQTTSFVYLFPVVWSVYLWSHGYSYGICEHVNALQHWSSCLGAETYVLRIVPLLAVGNDRKWTEDGRQQVPSTRR